MAVTHKHELYEAMEADWQMMTDSLKGERAIKDGGTVYLPMTAAMLEVAQMEKLYSARIRAFSDDPSVPPPPVSMGQSLSMYNSYAVRAEYPLWVKDSLRTMMGLVSRQEPEVALPRRMESMLEVATSDGFDLHQLYLRIVRALLSKGRAPLVGDFDASGLPYIATYTAESAINWRMAELDGRSDLVLVVFEEERDTGEGDEFSPKFETVYRVLDIMEGAYRVRVMRNNGELLEEEYPGLVGGTRGRGLTFLPVVYAGTTDNDPNPDEVPLLTMAKAALIYYRMSADYYQSMHHTAHPQPVISGIGDADIRVTGPMAAWTLEDPQSKAYYLEFSGASIDALRQSMVDQRQSAAEAGAKVIDTGSQESGESRTARQADQHSTLYSLCVTAGQALQQMLRYLGEWMGMSPAEVAEITFKVEPKFTPEDVDAAMLKVLSDIVSAGHEPREILHDAMRKAGFTEMTDEELDALIVTTGE